MITLAKKLSLFSQIKNANLSRIFFVCCDVTCLFTNIPRQETIDIAVNLIFNHNPNLIITKKAFDGVAMGLPLAPVLANIFMPFYESKWLNEYNLNKPKFYLRYVDDLLAAFDKEEDSLIFFNVFLNKRHPVIEFTIEKQINHSFTFLD